MATANLVVLKNRIPEDPTYRNFLTEIQRRRRGRRRIAEVFVVPSVSNPTAGKIEKLAIKRNGWISLELANGRTFGPTTGRSLYGDTEYIFSVDDRRVWNVWETQWLMQKIQRAIANLSLKHLQIYADVLDPSLLRLCQMLERLGLRSGDGT
jgi:hypothetical protein